jgi:uncharacterized protein (TIGR02466 family)|tara:strand:- start:4 stop:576 length:573 start_codon:yes stop_codon:yes gene_type:complete
MNIIPLFMCPIFMQDLDFDLKPIQKECIYRSKKDKGRIKSNLGGWQSNLLSEHDSFFPELISKINSLAIEFARGIDVKSNLKMNSFWININRFKDYNQYHTHPGSLFSGVYYIKSLSNSGNIEFKHPASKSIESYWDEKISNTNPLNSCVWEIEPVENRLLIFPSWLEHQVLPNVTQKDRISLSFNIDTL